MLVLVEHVTVLRPRRRNPAVVEAHVAKRSKGALVHAAVQTRLERKGLSPTLVSAFLVPQASRTARASCALHAALAAHYLRPSSSFSVPALPVLLP